MKKNIILSVWAFFLIIFETVLCRYIGINGAYPEIVFAFVICVAVLDNDLTAVTVISCICGLIMDCLGGGSVGVRLFSFGISAVLCNFITEKFFMPNFFVMLVCIVLTSFISRFLIFVFGFVIFSNANMAQIFIPLILQYVLYNTAAASVLYVLLKKTAYRKNMYDRR